MTIAQKDLADALGNILPLAQFHSAGSKLDIARAQRLLAEYNKQQHIDFEGLMTVVRENGGSVRITSAPSGSTWIVGIYFANGAKHEWGSGATIAEGLWRAVAAMEQVVSVDPYMGLA